MVMWNELTQRLMVSGRAFKILVVTLVGVVGPLESGCASTAARPASVGTMEDIINLQSDIEEQRGIIAGDGACQDRCRSMESICDAAARICEVASELAEVEALESCRRAERICHQARLSVNESCDC